MADAYQGNSDNHAGTAVNWPLLGLCALLPLQNIYLFKLPSLGGGFNAVNVLLLLAVIFALVAGSRGPVFVVGIRRQAKIFFALMIVSLIKGTLYLGHIGEGHLFALKDQLLPVLLFFVAVRSVETRKQLSWLLALILLPIPYMFRVFRSQLGYVASWHYSDDLRTVNGTFSTLGSNEFAAFFVFYSMLVISLLIYSKSKKTKVVLGVLLGISAYCILYSYSRGAWVAFIAGIGYLLFVRSRKWAMIAIICMTLGSGVVAGFFPVSVQERFGTIAVEEGEARDNSAESRLVLWRMAFPLFLENPVLGIGFHTFHHVNPIAKDTHNYFVKVMTEQGLPGILLVLVILATSFRLAKRLYVDSEDDLDKALGLGLMAMVLTILVANMFGDRFSHYPLISNFWILVGAVHGRLTYRERCRSEGRKVQ